MKKILFTGGAGAGKTSIIEYYNGISKRIIINNYKDIKCKQEKVIAEIERILQ